MKLVFYTLLQSASERKNIDLFINSLRKFGGNFKDSPVWIFHQQNVIFDFTDKNITLIPLEIDPDFQRIWFSAKVFAAAQTETLAVKQNIDNLVWFGSSGFIVQPPDQFDLGTDFDAAFRPVHHKNIGQLIDEKPDDFWRSIYEFIGLEDPEYSVETFVEGEKIRSYYNSHLFSINPRKQLLRKWKDEFIRFHQSDLPQIAAFSDQLHKIFIHQALLSTILVKHLDWNRLNILTQDYSYPLHLHHQIPPHKQPESLNELVCPVYEDIFKFPETLNGLEVKKPLADWLIKMNHVKKRTYKPLPVIKSKKKLEKF